MWSFTTSSLVNTWEASESELHHRTIYSIGELGAGEGLGNVRKRGKVGDGVVDGNTRREGDAYTISLMRTCPRDEKEKKSCLWRP